MTLYEILTVDDVIKSINENLDYLLELIPEIKNMIGFQHNNPDHHLDVWKHTLLALSLSSCDFDIRLALLLHDIGKPFSYQDDGDIRHFKDHSKLSSEIARKILKRLSFDDNYIDYISYLIRHHDYPISNKEIEEKYNLCLKLYEIQKCDMLAHNPDALDKRKEYLKKIGNKLFYKVAL